MLRTLRSLGTRNCGAVRFGSVRLSEWLTTTESGTNERCAGRLAGNQKAGVRLVSTHAPGGAKQQQQQQQHDPVAETEDAPRILITGQCIYVCVCVCVCGRAHARTCVTERKQQGRSQHHEG